MFRALADTDADGKMDLIEFSIACKLISAKLRNVEVPKLLPPTLLASLKHIGTPIRTPTGTMSPIEGYKQFLPPVSNVSFQQPVANVPVAAPLIAQQMMQQPMHPQTQMMMNQVQPIAIQPQQQISPEMLAQQQPMMVMQPQMMVQPQQMTAQPALIPTGTVLPSQPPMMTNSIQNIAPAQVVPVAKPPLLDQLSNSSLLDSLSQTQPLVVSSGQLPAAPTPTPPQSGQASRSMSFSEKAPSVPDSP